MTVREKIEQIENKYPKKYKFNYYMYIPYVQIENDIRNAIQDRYHYPDASFHKQVKKFLQYDTLEDNMMWAVIVWKDIKHISNTETQAKGGRAVGVYVLNDEYLNLDLQDILEKECVKTVRHIQDTISILFR